MSGRRPQALLLERRYKMAKRSIRREVLLVLRIRKIERRLP